MYSVTITVTEKCNLNCVYCYERVKSSKNMSFETAKEILDEVINYGLLRYDVINIQFFGGEPFLNYELIKKCVDYVQIGFPDERKKIRFLATTNGTVLDFEMKQWLHNNRDIFFCGLSLDGKKTSHDTNRSNSFDLIDLSFFKQNWPDYPVKMTVSPLTLKDLAADVMWLHSYGFKIKCNFAVGINWDNAGSKRILEEQLDILIEYYVNNPSIELCSLLNVNFEKIVTEAFSGDELLIKHCGIGSRMCAYDIEGRKYPCQFFCENALGLPYDEVKDISVNEKYTISLCDEACQSCALIKVCPNCYGANYQSFNNCYKKDMHICEFFKRVAIASSTIQAKRFIKNNYSERRGNRLFFKGILEVQERLRHELIHDYASD